ncbi:CPBP family intramembrane glutamic endopeptidase [Solimicrobium silvestre]|uniref:CAAX protease self-immunity n=1 Tax=Solimicrobium silvestre TaxID=2099400 RepID=A0A2S9GXX5_9BURK|nr:CPBP family intramembrane glutamic endopeptidase [Solimicrobium silvestre]PRC92575.1 CAAX protease self-immunity [Solimicrobium silvestre]
MASQTSIFITFVLLALAICSAWLKPIHINERFILPPWVLFFIASMVSGLVVGVLSPLAIVELGIFCGAAYLAQIPNQKFAQRFIFGSVTAIIALALAMHKLPGFNNPVIISSMTLSAGAATFTQYANFDKGVVGLILLAFLCSRANTLPEWAKLLKQTFPIALITTVAVLGVAIGLDYVKPDFKITQTTALFLGANLFFTVIAEEAFFRGFLQNRLSSVLTRFRYGQLIAIICSALLFGAVHAGGGITIVLLASIAGFGYAYAYYVTRRIEAPIIVHFVLNAVHFIGFTYPHLN